MRVKNILIPFSLIFLNLFSSQSWVLKSKCFPINKLNCFVWNPEPQTDETVTCTSQCSNKKLSGIGI